MARVDISHVLTCDRVLGVEPKHPWDEYVSQDFMNPSTLAHGLKSMKHLKSAWDYPDQSDTEDKQTGRAIHCFIYEPRDFEKRYTVYDDVRNPRHAKYQAFIAANPGKEVLSTKQWDAVIEAGKAFVTDKVVMQRFQSGQAEVTLYGEIAGVQFKGRVDWIETEPIIDDLKTAQNILARAFGRDFYDYGYDLKLAIYRELYRQNSFMAPQVNVICLEKKRPYDAAVVPVPESVLDRGFNKALNIIERMKECIETGEWPGVANGTEYYLDTPVWEMDDGPVKTQ